MWRAWLPVLDQDDVGACVPFTGVDALGTRPLYRRNWLRRTAAADQASSSIPPSSAVPTTIDTPLPPAAADSRECSRVASARRERGRGHEELPPGHRHVWLRAMSA
jgi:hypothetical protein